MKMDTEDLKHQLENEFYSYEHIFTYRIYNAWGRTFYLDFCILSDKQKPDKKVIRFQKRLFGITKNMTKSGETKPRWVVFDTFNLNPEQDFPRFYDIMQKFKEGKLDEVNYIVQSIDLNTETKQMAKLSQSLRKYSSKERRNRRERQELHKSQEEVVRLSSKLNMLNEQNRKLRLQSFKANIGQYRKVLIGIRRNLDKEADNESYFQEELSVNKWIFGPWYEDVLPKRKADTRNEPDFVLKRFDGFADIVEIEAPSKLLFRTPDKSNKSQPRAELV